MCSAPPGGGPVPSPGTAGSDLGASGESGADGHARGAVVPYGTDSPGQAQYPRYC